MKKLFVIALAVLCIGALAAPCFAEALTPQLCKEKTIEAAKLLETEGSAALEKIKDPNGPFRFANGEGYIWVHNLDGIMVMHPIKPSLDGKSVIDMRDVNGVYLFAAMNEIAEDYGSGWVPYSWPKPGEEKSSPKVSFVMLAHGPDGDYVAGCGMYDVTADEIKKDFPNDAIYED